MLLHTGRLHTSDDTKLTIFNHICLFPSRYIMETLIIIKERLIKLWNNI